VSSERERQRLIDIIENINRAQDYLGDMSFAVFAQDHKTVDACERCLQRITEAVTKIGPERMHMIAPEIPVAAVRGLGNILRHEYDNIDLRSIYNTITDDLSLLHGYCIRALQAQ
jgi:uncharacterized protein with HEPN domain